LFALGAILMNRPQPPLLPQGVLRVGIDPSNPPFAYYSNNDIIGLEIDLANLVAERLGVEIAWVALGFDGLYDALRSDRADIIIASVTPDPLRRNDAIYSRPYYDAGLVLVSPTARRIDQMNELDSQRLTYAFGSQAHTESDRWLRRVAPYITLPYELPTYALDAVRLGAANAALVSATDAQVYGRLHTSWQWTATYITHQPYVIAVNTQQGQLASTLDTLLATLEADATLAMLRERWLY
jgi:polar amino acid transport system substrate-binding protein